jgi:VanZ family protein
VLLLAAALSLGCELAQYYVAQRQTSASDVYANIIGALCGAACALALGRPFRAPLLRAMAADCFPALLLAAWLAFRTLPHVEAAYFHAALRSVVILPVLPRYDLFRETVEWLMACALVEAVLGSRRWGPGLALCAAAVLGSALLAPLAPMNLADAAGPALAIASWSALRRLEPRRGFAGLALLVSLLLVLARLEPFFFVARPRPFGWLPFRSLVEGPDALAIHSLLGKLFLYGGALWALGEAGMAAGAAALLVVSTLFLTSLAETHIPWRSAEITDAVLGLIFAGLRAALRRAPPPRPDGGRQAAALGAGRVSGS